MEPSHARNMVYRFSWFAGLGAVALGLLRLQRVLLIDAPTGEIAWPLVVGAAVVVGLVVTLLAARLPFLAILGLNLLALIICLNLLVAPGSGWGPLPSWEGLRAVAHELDLALGVLRRGVPPVTPIVGLQALVGVVAWGLGALLAWGLTHRRPYIGVLPALVFYLQVATLDRTPTGQSWLVWLLVVSGLTLAAVTVDEHRVAGRRAGLANRALPVALIAILVLGSTAALGSLDDLVPAGGKVTWRWSGLGGGLGGSKRYNPFVEIRRRLVSLDETPVFIAAGDKQIADQYWRLLSLDSFNGSWFYSSQLDLKPAHELPWGSETSALPGTSVRQQVTVLDLAMEWLPAIYSPVEVSSQDRLLESLKIASDLSLHLDAATYRGLRYAVVSRVPQLDYRLLGFGPLLAAAAEAGVIQAPSVSQPPPASFSQPDLSRYLQLPQLDPVIGQLARRQTAGLESPFEIGLALEYFFREGGGFRYSTSVPTAASDSGLATWLSDETSLGYRTGYCEQFAASMAVLARTRGVPSRVVIGFTPGELANGDSVVVRDKNAHAWVELWQPGAGWVSFDPTPRSDGANPPTARQLGPDFSPVINAYLASQTTEGLGGFDGRGGEFAEEDLPASQSRPAVPFRPTDVPGWLGQLGLAIVISSGLIGFVPLVKAIRRRRRLRRLQSGDVSAAWSEIVDRLADSGRRPRPSATPFEVALATDQEMLTLADVYAGTIYGERSPSSSDLESATWSLVATERSLRERETRGAVLVRNLQIRSLLPDSSRPLASRLVGLLRRKVQPPAASSEETSSSTLRMVRKNSSRSSSN